MQDEIRETATPNLVDLPVERRIAFEIDASFTFDRFDFGLIARLVFFRK
jgi:hypothetical protein